MSTAESGDRRRTLRLDSSEDHGIVQARVRAGAAAVVLNVSAGGALLETESRLLPGSSIELHLTTAAGRTAARGRVLRCAVAALGPASVCYRGAICFDQSLPWIGPCEGTVGSVGYPLPAAECRRPQPPRADITQQVL